MAVSSVVGVDVFDGGGMAGVTVADGGEVD